MLEGFMLGSAVGDALGLPLEGLSRQRVRRRMMTNDGRVELRHRFIFGRGWISDDTEHMAITAEAWLAAGGDVARFRRSLAWRLRWWFLAVPPATGLATMKACVRLLIGVPASRSGVRSAGNGPVMRAGVLGVLCDDEEELRAFVEAAARLTHTDQRAVDGAMAIALAARAEQSTRFDQRSLLDQYLDLLRCHVADGAMRNAIEAAAASVQRGEPTETFADSIGCERGVSGFVMHTAPVVVHAWLSHREDYEAGVGAMIALGGDTDSTAAAIGGLLGVRGAAAGDDGVVPQRLVDGVVDWPHGVGSLRRLIRALERGDGRRLMPVWVRWLVTLPRSVLFLGVVLVHVLGRVGR